MNKFNFVWTVIYLRNSGQRVRAIILAQDMLSISLVQAREWVDSVQLKRQHVSQQTQREMHEQYPCGISEERLRDYTVPVISHWPDINTQ